MNAATLRILQHFLGNVNLTRSNIPDNDKTQHGIETGSERCDKLEALDRRVKIVSLAVLLDVASGNLATSLFDDYHQSASSL